MYVHISVYMHMSTCAYMYVFMPMLLWLRVDHRCCIHIYTHLPYHNDSISNTDRCMKDNAGTIKMQEGRKTQEVFFNKIYTSHFICKVCV